MRLKVQENLLRSVGTLSIYGEAGTWYCNSLPVPGFNATATEIPEMEASFSYDPNSGIQDQL